MIWSFSARKAILPGASYVNPDDLLREALTMDAAPRVTHMTHLGGTYTPIGKIVSEKAVVNAIVGVPATGGSNNQTIHLVAVARAAGIRINWDDFSDLSTAVPLLARIYPNGPADINGFQDAGGMAALITELLEGGFLHLTCRPWRALVWRHMSANRYWTMGFRPGSGGGAFRRPFNHCFGAETFFNHRWTQGRLRQSGSSRRQGVRPGRWSGYGRGGPRRDLPHPGRTQQSLPAWPGDTGTLNSFRQRPQGV